MRNGMNRAVLKAISYRLLSTVLTGCVLSTGGCNWKTALAFTSVDAILKLGLYVAHERMWARVRPAVLVEVRA